MRKKGQRGKTEVGVTLKGDLTRANEVALVADEDDGCLGLSLPQQKSELSGAVEATPVSHRKHQDAHLAQQGRQVLRGQTHTVLQYKLPFKYTARKLNDRSVHLYDMSTSSRNQK